MHRILAFCGCGQQGQCPEVVLILMIVSQNKCIVIVQPEENENRRNAIMCALASASSP